MLVVVRKPHTNFKVQGNIPDEVLNFLEITYGSLVITEDENEKLINIRDTKWFKSRQKNRNPGTSIKTYRENKGWTQSDLGKKLGNLSRQNVSEMERGKRSISLNMAKKLSDLFDVNLERFVKVE